MLWAKSHDRTLTVGALLCGRVSPVDLTRNAAGQWDGTLVMTLPRQGG